MSNVKMYLAAGAIALAPLSIGLPAALGQMKMPVSTHTISVPAAPQEDEAGWDCEIHGNKVCGPEVEAALAVHEWLMDTNEGR